jgi:SSS family solute:Na+ symporter
MWVSYKNKGSENYFAGGRTLKWYTIAGSIFGTNISALHLVGMLGIGFSVGFAQSHFELLAIFAIVALAFIFIPLYRKVKIFTLSQFLELRFNTHVRLTYSVMMMLLILVQMVASFYIGARAIALLTKGSNFPVSYETAIMLQAIIICSYTMFGGLRAVMITESFQTIFIIIAAIILFGFTFSQPEINGFSGLMQLEKSMDVSMQKMHLYLPSNHESLPWTGVFTGLMVLHFFYWNSNQFIVQRIIAAENDKQAQLGVLGAGFLKLLIPFLTISTGVAAAHIFQGRFKDMTILPDDAFLYLVDAVIPKLWGLTGLLLAGVAAAVFSTIDAMMNATSTLFTIDIYKKYIRPNASDSSVLKIGRIAVLVMAVFASLLAILTHNPNSADNFFLTVSSRGSYFTPGIIIAFFGGIVIKRASAKGALLSILSAPIFSLLIESAYNDYLTRYPLFVDLFGLKLNFLHRIFFASILSFLVFLLFLKKKSEENNLLTLSFKSMKNIFIRTGVFIFCNLALALLITHDYITNRDAAWISSILSFVIFCFGIHLKEVSRHLAKIFAGVLIAITTFILFWFW